MSYDDDRRREARMQELRSQDRRAEQRSDQRRAEEILQAARLDEQNKEEREREKRREREKQQRDRIWNMLQPPFDSTPTAEPYSASVAAPAPLLGSSHSPWKTIVGAGVAVSVAGLGLVAWLGHATSKDRGAGG
jgi:hypothetical protein